MVTFLQHASAFLVLWSLVSVGSSALIYKTGRLPLASYEQPQVLDKLALLEGTDRVDTVFVGSSRVYRQLDPVEFDEGRSGVSVNLGVDSLLPLRTYDVLDAAVQARPDAQLWVIELMPLAYVGPNWRTEPQLRALTADRARTVAEYVRVVPLKPIERFVYARGYAKVAVYKTFGFGAARALGFKADTPEEVGGWQPDLQAHRGFVSLNEEAPYDPVLQSYNDDFMLDPEGKLARRMQRPASPDPGSPPTRYVAAIVDRAERLRADGKDVVFFLPPRGKRVALPVLRTQQLALEAHGFLVVDFDDPQRYPDLFKVELAFDAAHLNEAGSKRFTLHVREALAESGALPSQTRRILDCSTSRNPTSDRTWRRGGGL